MKNRVLLSIALVLSVFFGFSAVSLADQDSPLSSVGIGILGEYAFDNPVVNTAVTQKPAPIGGELELGFKDTPFSYKMQMTFGEVGTNLAPTMYSATYINAYIQYNFKMGALAPYIGVGYSHINISPTNSLSGGSVGWILGSDYYMSPSFKVGAFYSGFQPPYTAAYIYNYFLGVDIGYKFNL